MKNNQGLAKRAAEYFLSFDFFGIQPNLNIFKKQKYSTLVGAFMTFAVGFITLAYLSIEIQELITKSLPNVIQSDKQVVETSSFPLTQSNFTLAVSVANINQNPLKKIDEYFTFTINNCLRTRKLNSTTQNIDVTNVCTEYPTEACTSDSFVTDSQKQFFSKIRLGALQCIKKDVLETNPPSLQGIISGNEYAYITITLAMCKNTTTFQSCAPEEEILEGLSTGYYIIYLSDTLLQMGNTGDISQDIIKMQYTTFSKTSSITIYQTFRIIESLTDEGLIGNSVSNDYNLIQQNYREQFQLYNDEYLIYHWLILDDKYTQYQRSYIKVQAILSKIGGLWQILFLTIAILLKPFIETDMYLKICNEIFRIEPESSKQRDQNESSKSKSHFSKMIEQLNPKFENSILDVFFITLNCKRKKKIHLEQAKMAFQCKLDVVDISLKAFQLEQLKQIILSDEQQQLFEFIPRPVIPFDNGDKMDFCIQSTRIKDKLQCSKFSDEHFRQACRAFERIMADQSDISLRLLKYIDNDMLLLFQQQNYSRNYSQFQLSMDILNKKSIYLDQKNRDLESQVCFSPISLKSPVAKVLHIEKKNKNN